jgi:hypothetical protein
VPLVLKRNDRSEAADRFLVYSGKAVVGTLMRVPSGEKQGWRHLSPAFTSLGPSAGMSPW